MLLQEPPESPYDLHFSLFGFPIRIAWTFWLGAVVFGYSLVDFFDRVHFDGSPGRLPLLLLWAVCVLVSVTIHELGHAFAFRQFGIESSIVLYHFGGLAIPGSHRASGGFGNDFATSLGAPRLSYGADLWIALAGPLAQLGSAAILIGALMWRGFDVWAFRLMPDVISDLFAGLDGDPIENVNLLALVTFYIFPSVLWALFNLVPVFPLDGGRVMRSVALMLGSRDDTWLWISLISAIGMAYLGFTNEQLFVGILFVSLAMGNYQMMRGSSGY